MLNTQTQNNNFVPTSVFLIENRQRNDNTDAMWDQLNLSQQYSVCSLGQFGYLLSYVRSVGESTLAILKQNDKVATINEAGNINTNPSIICRQ